MFNDYFPIIIGIYATGKVSLFVIGITIQADDFLFDITLF